MKKETKNQIILYKTKDGKTEIEVNLENETVWLSQKQMAELFSKDVRTINEHIKNVFKEGELKQNSVIRKFRITASDGKSYETNFYNLDVIISVGYRVKSFNGTQFRIWATNVLKQYLIKGYTINRKQIGKNYETFLKAVEDVKKLLPAGGQMKAEDTLELMKAFASTWFSLEAYDKESLPKKGATKKQIKITADEISKTLLSFRAELIAKKEAGDLFGIERTKESVAGIVGNVFQTFGKKELYPTLEDKAAHILYFMVKNHPFVDGNKRSGAFAFVWFLKKARILDMRKITPEALTALTLLVAESNPKDKDRMIGIILLLLK